MPNNNSLVKRRRTEMNYQESENNNNNIYLSQWPVLLSLTTKKKIFLIY